MNIRLLKIMLISLTVAFAVDTNNLLAQQKAPDATLDNILDFAGVYK